MVCHRLGVLAGHVAGRSSQSAAAGTCSTTRESARPAPAARGRDLPFEPKVHFTQDSLPGAFGIELTPAEISQWKEEGWIVKRGLIPRQELESWVDRVFDEAKRVAPMVPGDPRSWVDPANVWEANQKGDGTRISDAPELSASSEMRWHEVGHDPAFLAATSRHPNVLTVVESIVGGPVRIPNRNRGIYCIWPRSNHLRAEQPLPIQAQLGPHIDSSPAEMQCAIYLDDVGSHAGGFTLWPRSPQMLYRCMKQDRNYSPTAEFGPTFERIKKTIRPIEFSGKAGDVIFYRKHQLWPSKQQHRCLGRLRRAPPGVV